MNVPVRGVHFEEMAEHRAKLDCAHANRDHSARPMRPEALFEHRSHAAARAPDRPLTEAFREQNWPLGPEPLPWSGPPPIEPRANLFQARATASARHVFVRAQATLPSAPAPTSAPGAAYILPSFALSQLDQRNSAMPAISLPLLKVSRSTQARVRGHDNALEDASIFKTATRKSAAFLEEQLAAEPRAIWFLHPSGYNLLHHVVQHCSPEHVGVVLKAAERLPGPMRMTLLDGLDNDGRDAVFWAIDRGAVFSLAKLLDGGCDPTRRRIKPKLNWYVRVVHPMRPDLRIEDACLYAMRKGFVAAVDLLLLWDERRCANTPNAAYAFERQLLMAAAIGIELVHVRNAMMDVLHAAQARRCSRR